MNLQRTAVAIFALCLAWILASHFSAGDPRPIGDGTVNGVQASSSNQSNTSEQLNSANIQPGNSGRTPESPIEAPSPNDPGPHIGVGEWWANERTYEDYLREFENAVVNVSGYDTLTGIDEALEQLRDVNMEDLTRVGLAPVSWSAIGELSDTRQVELILDNLRSIREVDHRSIDPSKRDFYIREVPFMIAPESMLSLLAERTIMLNDEQRIEVATLYWGALGERARVERDAISVAVLADNIARSNLGLDGKMLDGIPSDSERVPAQLAEAYSLRDEVNRRYTSLMLGYIHQNGL